MGFVKSKTDIMEEKKNILDQISVLNDTLRTAYGLLSQDKNDLQNAAVKKILELIDKL